eukprot:3395590-Amphidinium_carterae.1
MRLTNSSPRVEGVLINLAASFAANFTSGRSSAKYEARMAMLRYRVASTGLKGSPSSIEVCLTPGVTTALLEGRSAA